MTFSMSINTTCPAYQQIVNAVCQAVRDGQLAPGDKVDPEQIMAARLKISRPTVSRGYAQLRDMNVLESTRGRGSFISEQAFSVLGVKPFRSMRKIAYAVSAIGRMNQIPSYIRHMVYDSLEGIAQRLEDTPATLSHICIGRWDKLTDLTNEQSNRLANQLSEFDGILLQAEEEIAKSVIPLILEAKLPCVQLYRPSQYNNIPHVIYNNAGAVRLAVNHLAKQGYKSIGYLGTDDRLVEGNLSKYTAFHQAIADNNLELNPEHVWLVHHYGAEKTIEEYLSKTIGPSPSSTLPQAFFIGTDHFAIQALYIFQAQGINIPKQLGIMSFDDVYETSLIRPALSTVHVPRHSIGYEAADILFRWPADDSTIPESKVLHADLSLRETCPEVEKIIWNNTEAYA